MPGTVDTMRLLVHVCCAPCFTYPHRQLMEEGHEVTGFFYNPNIHPQGEYNIRRNALEHYAKISGAKVLYDTESDSESYLRGARAAEDRCRFCYTFRLAETARTARSMGFDAFTTTLLISPYQKHELLAQVGRTIADEIGVEFHYEDFRSGYRESRERARFLKLYMQKYCGCVFSENDRKSKQKP